MYRDARLNGLLLLSPGVFRLGLTGWSEAVNYVQKVYAPVVFSIVLHPGAENGSHHYFSALKDDSWSDRFIPFHSIKWSVYESLPI